MIRPLHPNDSPELYDLLQEPSPLWCDHFGSETDQATFQALVNEPPIGHHRLVTIRENRLVGLGILKRSTRARLAHVGEISLLLPYAATDSLLGQELLSALIDLADNWLNIKRLESSIPACATDLALLLNQAGFETEGLMKKSIWFNGGLYDENALARLRGLDRRHPDKLPAIIIPEEKSSSALSSELMIRQMENQDIDDLYEIFRAPENCRTTLQLPSQELWLTRQRVLDPPPGLLRLVAESDRRVIGVISLMPRAEACRIHIGRIGMMVHRDYWGHGIGSRLMGEILRLADEELGLKRVELQVHTDNPAGIRLYEKFGFVVEGTKHFQNYGAGRWADTYFMARLLE